MYQEHPTMSLCFKFLWAFFWRWIILMMILAFLLGIAFGIIFEFFPLGLEFGIILGGVLCVFIGIYSAAFVTRILMSMGFGEYKLVVVKKQDAR